MSILTLERNYLPLDFETKYHCFRRRFEFGWSIRKLSYKRIDNYLERYCRLHKIKYHLIRPRTPEHNGKVERSHRIDQDKFYRKLKFYSLDNLRKQGAYWNKRYNNLPKVCLNFKTPNEVELGKLKELFENEGEIRCSRMSHII